jgi:hypothetical protein
MASSAWVLARLFAIALLRRRSRAIRRSLQIADIVNERGHHRRIKRFHSERPTFQSCRDLLFQRHDIQMRDCLMVGEPLGDVAERSSRCFSPPNRTFPNGTYPVPMLRWFSRQSTIIAANLVAHRATRQSIGFSFVFATKHISIHLVINYLHVY